MATAKNAKIQFEAGQTLVPWEALSDSGDHQVFQFAHDIVSRAIDPVLRPDGVVTGLNMLSPGSSADAVAVAAFSAYSGGTLRSVAAGTVDISALRPLTDVARVISITMTSAGALAAVAGDSGTDDTFSEVRGAAGGPPLIPAGSVELGQIRTTAAAAAVLDSAEVFQNGAYTERSDMPLPELNTVGYGIGAATTAKVHAFVAFSEALPPIHTGNAPKGVWAQYYVPNFADVPRASDFVPAETSHSITTEQHYGGSISSNTESQGQASFKVLLDDGVTDALIGKKNQTITVRSYPDRNKGAYTLTQGVMGLSRQFPIGGQINATVTITPAHATAEYSG